MALLNPETSLFLLTYSQVALCCEESEWVQEAGKLHSVYLCIFSHKVGYFDPIFCMNQTPDIKVSETCLDFAIPSWKQCPLTWLPWFSMRLFTTTHNHDLSGMKLRLFAVSNTSVCPL